MLRNWLMRAASYFLEVPRRPRSTERGRISRYLVRPNNCASDSRDRASLHSVGATMTRRPTAAQLVGSVLLQLFCLWCNFDNYLLYKLLLLFYGTLIVARWISKLPD
jgi:hypothetical protein